MNLILPLVLVLLGAFAPLVDAAHVWADRVKQTSTITGTGSYSLDPSVPTGFQGFVTAIGNGNTTDYLATDGTNWEIVSDGVVTYSTPDTLSRPTICSSSNGGAAVNWSAADVTIVTVNSSCNLEDTGYKSLDEVITGDWVFSSSFTSPGIDDNADAMAITIDSNEKVVIGNTSTTYDLELFREGTTPDMAITGYSTNTYSGPTFSYRRAKGNEGTPAVVDSETAIATRYWYGWDGSGFDLGAYEAVAATETWTGTAHGTNWMLQTTPNGSTTLSPRIAVDGDGQVGFGTISPSYPLHLVTDSSTDATFGLARTSGANAFINATTTDAQMGSIGNFPVRILQNSQLAAAWDASKNLTLEGHLYVKDNKNVVVGADSDVTLTSGATTATLDFRNLAPSINNYNSSSEFDFRQHDGSALRTRLGFETSGDIVAYVGADAARIAAKVTEPSLLYGDWDLSGGGLSIPDNEFLYVGADTDIQIRHVPAGPFNIFNFYNADTYFSSQTDAKKIIFRSHDGTSINQPRLTIGPNNVYLYAGTGGSSAEKLRTDPSLSYLSGDWGTAAGGSFHVGSATAAKGPFSVYAGTLGRVSVSDNTTINDEASSAIESLVDGGTDGILRVFWDAGYACEFLIEGSGNAVIEVTDPRNKCSATDADTFLVVMADGDSTYTIKNRLGTQTAFTLIFMGRG